MTYRLLPAVLLIVAVTINIFGAFRGFELTDESYYFLNYLYSQDFVAQTTFFGLYFKIPFQLLNGSVADIRIFGLAILLIAALYYSAKLLEFNSLYDSPSDLSPSPFVTASMATVFIYYSHLTTLRAPSYNLLVLVCMLVSTGTLFGIVNNTYSNTKFIATSVVYGMTISICAFVKAPAALFLIIAHLFFFMLINRNWHAPRIGKIILWAAIGFAANIVLVQLAFQDWYRVLMRGLEFSRLMDGRNLPRMLIAFVEDLQKTLLGDWKAYLFVFSSYAFMLLVANRGKPRLISYSVIFLTSILSFWLIKASREFLIFFIVASLLLVTEIVSRKDGASQRFNSFPLALFALLLLLPVGYSWGTNMPIGAHSKMASIFPLTLCLLFLHRLRGREIINEVAYLLSVTALCVPPLWFQLAPWVNLERTYRLHTPLIEQRYVTSIGSPATSILADRMVHDDIGKIRNIFHSAGFAEKGSILDFTGDGVGLIYAVGGKPISVAWLLGGYPGSEKSTEYIINLSDANLLRNSWIITSDDNPRHIKEWKNILSRKLGSFGHKPVGSVCIRWPYQWGDNKMNDCYNTVVWKPAGV